MTQEIHMSNSRGRVRKINFVAAMIVPAICMVSIGCPTHGGSGSIQGCNFFQSTNWPGTADQFESPNLANCPINTPPGGRNQDYTATATLQLGSTNGRGELDFVNAHGNFITQSGNASFHRTTTNDDFAYAGSYTAGTIASSPGQTPADTARNVAFLFGGGFATLSAALTYQTTGKAADVFGASVVDPGMSTTLTGVYYQSDLVPPINFQWYQDGSPIGGATGQALQAYATSPNTENIYEFRVTDSQSRSVSAFWNLMTTAGCGTQVIC